MNRIYKKLLPKILQTTRWGELFDAFQSVTDTIKENKIDSIIDQFNIDTMTDTEIRQGASALGYTIRYLEGFCETTEYLKRQLLTVIPRILKRNTYSGYRYISKIYNLIHTVFPMYYADRLIPIYGWDTDPESTIELFILDAGYTLDSVDFPTLDASNYIESITRHVLYSYEYGNVEDSSSFMKENQLRALVYDINQHKRRTEVMYYEPTILVNNIKTVSINEEMYYSYDRLSSGVVRSYNSVPDLSSGSFIKLGNSSWGLTESNKDTITDVNSFIYRLDLDSISLTSGEISSGYIASGDIGYDCDILSQDMNTLSIRKQITQKQRLYVISSGDLSVTNIEYFTEMALFDASSGIMMYAEFPKVRMGFRDKQLYNNIAVKINLI